METTLWVLLHALCRLPGHVNAAHSVKLGFRDVQMPVEAASLTPLRDDREVGLRHVAHEEQDVDVTGLSAEKKKKKMKWDNVNLGKNKDTLLQLLLLY